jgi:hypothetical protein
VVAVVVVVVVLVSVTVFDSICKLDVGPDKIGSFANSVIDVHAFLI